MEQERTLALALCRVEGIGAVSIRKLLEKAGDVSEIRKLPAESLQKLLGEKKAALLKNWDAPENLERAKRQEEQWKKKGISFDFLWEEAFPKRLKEISDPPLVLYRIGKLPEPEKKMTAIVGARACSSYGKEMAEYFARGLAKEGIGIVSGMARGADGIAQRAALSAGGYSVAVLGCGVDICYPEENRPLYEKLKESGCILSEYPPGTLPHSRLFPPRNRIISALADAVIIIEAREKSGSLITADFALEQGKEVFALPGRANDPLSGGCNRLIQGGANMLLSPSDVLEFLGMKYERKLTIHKFSQNRLAKNENLVYASVDSRPRHLEEVAALSGLSVTECMEALLKLELAGLVFGTGNQYYKAE